MTTGRGIRDSVTGKLLVRLCREGFPWPLSLLYDRLSQGRTFRRHYELIADDILSRVRPECLLDIGTGPGWLLVKLHRLCPETRFAAVDISSAMIARARENLAKAGCDGRIEIHEAGAHALPFADGSFDTVTSTISLHHWKDPEVGLNEIHRVLRPGGTGLVYDVVKRMPQDALSAARRTS
jgi:ubiquinone/menaquinone biosynthesis C-methylase UbiE